MSRRPAKTPEGYVQSAILEYLAIEKVWHVRLNSRTVRLPGRGGKERPVFFGSPGMADILATPTIVVGSAGDDYTAPLPLWIECKGPNGKQTPDQKLFEESVIGAGHFYLLARGLDDVREWLQLHS